jgi:hypothetical protein
LERVRIAKGESKSKARLQAEQNLGRDEYYDIYTGGKEGYPLGNDDGKRWVLTG